MTGMQKAEVEEFHGLLLESLDEAIRAVLGDIPRQTLFSSLEENFDIKREDIPHRMEDFQKAFSALFGKAAPVMTRVIARNLCDMLHIPYYERKDLDLKMYVEDCRRRYEQEKER